MPQYALARHVFVCMQGEHVVFLDVRKDRYFALESARTAGLGEIVPGWPVPAASPVGYVQRVGEPAIPLVADQVDRSLSSVVALLLEKEILTTASSGKLAAPVVVEPLRGELNGEGLDDSPRIGVGTLTGFVSSSIRARLLLKYSSFESVIARVADRFEKRGMRNSTPADTRLDELVAAFATLRPFFFAAKDACLFDALALSEFLARHDVYPRWVFGVQARPFAAHCWLQLGGVVLNDTMDHVRRYTPIMVV
jgi:hypothetical protein